VEANKHSNMHASTRAACLEDSWLVVKHVCTLRASSHMDHVRACARHTRPSAGRPFPAGGSRRSCTPSIRPKVK
jgi:hypothetical protein